ncbi:MULTISPECIES: asparagine synthase-related protein [unclassified Caulobacter]|jgi:asparagine synthase (glutamine-hydrolysing)|uniref:asparagine synthase-related protein n=1 Tax=unclassified Caulobacter TaxID=2648921 RepID=UPI0006F95F69|nr:MULTISPECIES: asparagine synthase-related protein [unclassified Caulobacter]KQV54657.1 hypothetical protein ASC62_22980 [Caulobacter sp. Root342]KQV64046.1 hypothetical protein ASC70_19650 [Caulobacter sp. Root343]
MALDLVVASSGSPETLVEIEAKLARQTELRCQMRGDGFIVVANTAPRVRLGEGRGGVFGDLFARRDHHRIASMTDADGEAIVRSKGERLVREYWGDYLGVIAGEGGLVRLVRAPFAALTIYLVDLGDTWIAATDVGLLIDAGLLSPRIDWSFVAHFLAYPFHRSRRTGFLGVTEVTSGARLTLRPGRRPVEESLWSPWDYVRPMVPNDAAAMLEREVRACVRTCVEGRRQVLLELSGGLDSSILAASLWDTPTQVICVNMISPSPDGDERLFARAVTERLGLPLQEIALSPRDLDLVAPPKLRRPRPSAHALLGAWDEALTVQASELGVDAFVSGGGGDNVFFNTHGSGPAADALRGGAIGTWSTAVKDLARLHGCSVWKAARLSIRRALTPATLTWRSDTRFLAGPATAILLEDHPWLDPPAGVLPGKIDHVRGLMAVQNYLDGFPRASQAPILTPLLSLPIVELCLSIPSWTWIGGGQDRAVARQAFKARLPAIVIDRRAKGNLSGFAGPAFEAARPKLAEHLLGGRLDQAGLIDTASIRRALEETGPPKGSDFFRVLQIADVESWARSWS